MGVTGTWIQHGHTPHGHSTDGGRWTGATTRRQCWWSRWLLLPVAVLFQKKGQSRGDCIQLNARWQQCPSGRGIQACCGRRRAATTTSATATAAAASQTQRATTGGPPAAGAPRVVHPTTACGQKRTPAEGLGKLFAFQWDLCRQQTFSSNHGRSRPPCRGQRHGRWWWW